MIDTRIIARQSAGPGGLQVLAQRHEIMWRDGTTVTLHPVQANGLPMAMLRAVALPQLLLLVDLAKLAPHLGAELRACPLRDVPGLVFFTLRNRYGSALAFTADAQRKATGGWHLVGDVPAWFAAARMVDSELLATASMAASATPAAAQWCPQ